jgi:broad specificity phosphatase PhoE
MLNIYFVRHCQTDYTQEGLLRDEKHLCQDGRQQAIELKKQLQKSKIHFDAIYTSDMVR